MNDFNILIFGGYVNGYSIARTIYETYNIKPYIFDYRNHFSKKSKILNYINTFDPNNQTEEFIYDLIKFGKDNKKKQNIIFVTNDEWLIPISQNRKVLDEYFVLPFSEWNIIEKLTIKENLYKLCDEINLDYPKTELINQKNVENIKKLKFPILIKPSNVVKYINNIGGKRNHIFENFNNANLFLENSFKKYDENFVVQEYIPGGVENLYTATTYSNKEGEIKGISIGHKLTQYPSEAGTITSGYVDYVEEVEILTKKLLKESKYYGIANTEFKYDKRDKKYKLIEINPRPGMWNYSSLKSGVNLFELLIKDLQGSIDNDEIIRGKSNLIWTVISYKELKKTIPLKTILDKKNLIDPRKNKEESLFYKINLNKEIIINKIKRLIIKILENGITPHGDWRKMKEMELPKNSNKESL